MNYCLQLNLVNIMGSRAQSICKKKKIFSKECVQGTSFFETIAIQTIEYGLNDMIRTKFDKKGSVRTLSNVPLLENL